MRLVQPIHRFLRTFGVDLVRFNPATHSYARRQRLLKTYAIDLVLDVGANEGQYGTEMRDLGYRGRIVSFEPLPAPYAVLAAVARTDGAWQTFPYALGAAPGTALIHVAGNSVSSSLLDILPAHLDISPNARETDQQRVTVQTLDAVFESIAHDASNIYLKMDTQGYEKQVLDGATHSLPRIASLQVEMSLVPLYQDAPLLPEMLEHLDGLGYELVSVEPVFTDRKTGRLLQVDGIFHRYDKT